MHWLSPGDNSWQLTAATLVGLMSVPGLVVLYGGVMQKRWSVNSMMMAFIAFALVLIVWVGYGYKLGFGTPVHVFGADHGFFANAIGHPGSVDARSVTRRDGSVAAHELDGHRPAVVGRHWIVVAAEVGGADLKDGPLEMPGRSGGPHLERGGEPPTGRRRPVLAVVRPIGAHPEGTGGGLDGEAAHVGGDHSLVDLPSAVVDGDHLDGDELAGGGGGVVGLHRNDGQVTAGPGRPGRAGQEERQRAARQGQDSHASPEGQRARPPLSGHGR